MGSIPEVQFVQGSEMSSEVRAFSGLESVCDPVHVYTRLHCVPPLSPRPAMPSSRQFSMPQKPCHSRQWHILMPCLLCASVGRGKAGSLPTARLMTDARVGLQSCQACLRQPGERSGSACGSGGVSLHLPPPLSRGVPGPGHLPTHVPSVTHSTNTRAPAVL